MEMVCIGDSAEFTTMPLAQSPLLIGVPGISSSEISMSSPDD